MCKTLLRGVYLIAPVLFFVLRQIGPLRSNPCNKILCRLSVILFTPVNYEKIVARSTSLFVQMFKLSNTNRKLLVGMFQFTMILNQRVQ